MRRLARAFSVIRDHFRSLPPGDFVAFLAHSLFKYESVLIYCKGLGGGLGENEPHDIGVRKGDMRDLELGRTSLERVPWELQCDIYDGVKDFFVYQDDGHLGHISWLYYKDDPNRILLLGEGECEVKFCLTFQPFRGKGLYPATLFAIQAFLTDRGFKRCFICVKPENQPSIRGIEKARFRLVAKAHVLIVFGFQLSPRRDTRSLRYSEPHKLEG